ncbi:MAG: class I SAM-dependent methyltransferase [Arhodomonas sp.]|nr:class I SAM-dependent methyltransferase [Arhodomonas sp.]
MTLDYEQRALIRETNALLDDERLRGTLRRHAHYLHPDVPAGSISTDIHPHCQMLWHSLAHHRDAGHAVSQYFAVALQQYHTLRQIMDRVYGRDAFDLEVLDFACGYGRLLRFLIHSLPRGNITAAEILPEAVAYVGERLGVRTLESYADPTMFDPGSALM